MTEPKKLFLIDGMALAYRSFFAFQRPLYRGDGLPTSAIYGTAMFLNKLIQEEQPDYIACAWDGDEDTFRHEMYEEYKGTRSAMPDDLSTQLPYIVSLFEMMVGHVFSIPRFEADDVIGTLAKRFASENVHVYIVSGDKDFLQLVSDHIFVYTPKKNEEAMIYNRDAVMEKFQCTPEQVVDVLALMGDSVDNVPGVPGIGEKTAAQLIGKYGSLEGIYENIDQITAKKQKENLLNFKEDAFLSRTLVTLELDVPIKNALNDLTCDPVHATSHEALLAFYTEMEFKQLLERQAPLAKVKAPKNDRVVEDQVKKRSEYVGCDRLDEKMVESFSGLTSFAFAVSCDNRDIIVDRPNAVALFQNGKGYHIALRNEDIPLWSKLFSSPAMKVCHGLKEHYQLLGHAGIDLKAKLFCTKIADYLIDPNRDKHTLDAIVPRHLGLLRQSIDPSDQILSVDVENQLVRDAELAAELCAVLSPKLEDLGMMSVFQTIEIPLASVLARVEQRGLRIDKSYLEHLSDELGKKLEDVKARVHEHVGHSFNLGSPKQLQKVLFEELKIQDLLNLKRLKKTKTGYSTDESVLSQMTAHPVPRLILEFRELSVLKNTFVDALPTYIHPQTGRVHTKLHQTVAATGRLSSDSPNLQNIPMRTELGKRVRCAFVPLESGEVLISGDYSQVELRLLAELSGSSDLIEGFKKGLDIHMLTASKIFGIPLEDVTKDQRFQAKAINFGIIYGMGPQRLAAQTGVTMSEAKVFIEKYFLAYPKIRTFTQNLILQARQLGYSMTMTGRRRPIPGIHDGNHAVVARAENIAVNAPIQGSAADLIKLAMIKIESVFTEKGLKTKLILQIHDELLFSGPREEAEQAMDLIKSCMEQAMPITVPLAVEISAGENWLEAH